MRAIVLFLVSLSLFFALGCGRDGPTRSGAAGSPQGWSSAASGEREIVVGGLYLVQNDDNTYSVLKVLALDESAVHLRSYANRFEEPPSNLDPSVLTLGRIDDPGGFGIGHFPLAREGFFADSPALLMRVPVEDDELEGYRYYLDATESQ